MKARHALNERKMQLKRKIIMLFLIYLAIFTAYFSMSTLSKYTGISSGNGNADIAKWDVSIDTTGSTNPINLVAGNGEQNYNLKVTSNSEVGVKYSIFLSNVPSGIQVFLDGVSYSLQSGNKIICTDIGSFNAEDSNNEHNHTLTFKALLDSNVPNTNQIDIDVVFTQKEI